MSTYKVALDVYNGPLDLLLFLIRRDEIDIYDIPVARITDQYLEYVRLLEQIDPDVVSEFLVLAATLIEIKSRTLLPHPPAEEAQEEFVDPRLELVRQLLEYKKYKDAARGLEHAAEIRAMRHARSPVLPETAPDDISLDNVDIWNLLDAFNRMLRQIGKGEAFHRVTVDDTPITLHAADIVDSIQRAGGTQPFEEIFQGRNRGELIGLFLALLELIRQRRVRATQDRPFSTIHIVLLDARALDEVMIEPPAIQADDSAPEGGSVESAVPDSQEFRGDDEDTWLKQELAAIPEGSTESQGRPAALENHGNEPEGANDYESEQEAK